MRLSLITLFFMLFSTSAIKAEEAALAGGIYIKFKPDISIELRTKTHKKLQAIMRYRSKLTGIEHVIPSNKKEWYSRSSLKRLCESYQKEEIVEYCLPAEKGSEARDDNLPDVELVAPATNPCKSKMQSFSEKEISFAKFHLKAASYLQKCELVDSFGKGKSQLSFLWAQDLIGADLAKKLVLSSENAKEVTYSHFEDTDLNGVEDAHLSSAMRACKKNPELPSCPNSNKKNRLFFHGTNVASLVSDSITGVAAKAQFVAGAVLPDTNTSENFLQTTDVIASEKPDLLCSSVVFNDHPTFTTGLNTILNKGTIMVQGSGNSYPRPSSVSLQDRAIMVGSISPFGFPSGFSSESENVIVLAPSDNFLKSRDAGTGEFTGFSGTSGAQPLVCGAVANVLSILPGMTSDEAKLLLKKTAQPTSNSKDDPKRNGVGTLNAFKMAAVAQRLASGWPENREMLKNSKLYDFKEESNTTKIEGLKLLNSKAPCDKRSGLDLVRTSFLLNPENSDARKKLAEVYRGAGLTMNAAFYDSFEGFTFPKLKELLEKNINDFSTTMGILRQASKLNKVESLSLLKWGIEHATRSEVVRLGEGELSKILTLEEQKQFFMEAFIKSDSMGAVVEIAEILKGKLNVPTNELIEQLKKSKYPTSDLILKKLEIP